AKEYPDVELEHMLIDACSMRIIQNPRYLDVLVTENTFGDILSDEAAMLTGSIGMLASASIGKEKSGAMYEPIHGSAPDIAGTDAANPVAAILSVAMMLKYSFDMIEASEDIENAVESVLSDGIRTADIYTDGMTKVGCRGMGEAILKSLA
ncbi:MAG: 3-isopropylmalate dehydrogenase, partial [Deltaproteobacteria bacterium]|nr:3-isopropylmalate dehydrogenase [Deltaproteobacteria bacterium]